MSDTTPIGERPLRAAATLGGRLTVVGGLAGALVVLMFAASLVGAYPVSLSEMLAAVGRWLTGAPAQGQIDTVLFEVRLPRVFAAVLAAARSPLCRRYPRSRANGHTRNRLRFLSDDGAQNFTGRSEPNRNHYLTALAPNSPGSHDTHGLPRFCPRRPPSRKEIPCASGLHSA